MFYFSLSGNCNRRSHKALLPGPFSLKKLLARQLRIESLESRRLLSVTWDGGGGDGKWSTAANWVGDVAPRNGDAIIFSGTGSSRITTSPTAGAFPTITFASSGFTLGGAMTFI